jgi:hypothetical protein
VDLLNTIVFKMARPLCQLPGRGVVRLHNSAYSGLQIATVTRCVALAHWLLLDHKRPIESPMNRQSSPSLYMFLVRFPAASRGHEAQRKPETHGVTKVTLIGEA